MCYSKICKPCFSVQFSACLTIIIPSLSYLYVIFILCSNTVIVQLLVNDFMSMYWLDIYILKINAIRESAHEVVSLPFRIFYPTKLNRTIFWLKYRARVLTSLTWVLYDRSVDVGYVFQLIWSGTVSCWHSFTPLYSKTKKISNLAVYCFCFSESIFCWLQQKYVQ